MAVTSVSFLSSRGRGISNDLKVMQTGLAEQLKNVEFRYFVTSEVVERHIVKKSHKAAKKKFCEELTNAVCVDVSLEPSRKLPNTNGKRILEAIPYGYQFEYACEQETELQLKNSLKNFTHVLAPSPFTAKLLKEKYNLDQIEVIDGFCSPLAWDLNQKDKQNDKRKKLEYLFPAMKGKKILAILTNGKNADEHQLTYQKMDMKIVLDALDGDWFILTNCEQLLACTGRLPYRYHTKFGFANHCIAAVDVLYVADALVTNNSHFASAFASKRCPTYALQYGNSWFEKYVEEKYPKFFVTDLLKFVIELRAESDFDAEQRTFCEWLSYAADRNPVCKICELLK